VEIVITTFNQWTHVSLPPQLRAVLRSLQSWRSSWAPQLVSYCSVSL